MTNYINMEISGATLLIGKLYGSFLDISYLRGVFEYFSIHFMLSYLTPERDYIYKLYVHAGFLSVLCHEFADSFNEFNLQRQ